MTVLVTGDIHWSENAKEDYRHQWVKWLVTTIQKKEATTLIILGDLTNSKDRHDAWLTNKVADHIHELSNICKVIIQMGNHDYLATDNPFFEFLRFIPNVRWIGVPTSFQVEDIGNCLFLPHTRNYKKDLVMLD